MHPQSPALRALAEKWNAVPAAERANFQSYATELCDALGVERPRPRGSGYEFEYPVTTTDRRTGRDTTNFIDLYRQGHFILEAKHTDAGTGADRVLGAAYGQAKGYAGDVPHAPPPYLMVMNVARTLLVWDRWGGNYGGVNAARRIDLRTLWQRDDDIEFLRVLWENPASLNPTVRGRVVTREVAERLAKLSASLEARGFDGLVVAQFLMRCVFTMFAEDVGLLPEKLFQAAVESYRGNGRNIANEREGSIYPPPPPKDAKGADAEFVATLEELWSAMDEGKRFGLRRLLRFNGHFFRDAKALPLTPADISVLAEAAEADWRYVEPSIFGTLLTRALDPRERHRLGAEYTPREYVERVVRQTVDVPLRERWAPVQAHVAELIGSGRTKDRAGAMRELRGFHTWLLGLRFLDPACGSGNFLYVTMFMVKRIELEVFHAIEDITGNPELGIDDVGPGQFFGIELKPWARGIAELTLWIGYHQFWAEHHRGVNPREPVLKDIQTLDLRDAVLAWDEIVEIPERSRPDRTPHLLHRVPGDLVLNPQERLTYHKFRGARQAGWPTADFIVGNPPYMGDKRMRELFGDGYVDALRSAYPLVPNSADFVMYWWFNAANEIAEGRATRAGLITTNSITQTFNRKVVEWAAERGVRVEWAAPDHPWVDEEGGAAVRIAMTVFSKEPMSATLVQVADNASIMSERVVPVLNADMSAGADVASSTLLLNANSAISSFGYMLAGRGFVLECKEAEYLQRVEPRHSSFIRPYRNGRDLTARPRDVYLIDFGLLSEAEARGVPMLYDIVRDRVKPTRDVNNRAALKRNWWRFAEPRRTLREACRNLERFIVTPETAKHRFFTFVESRIAPDHMLVCVASEDAFHLGILSSAIHVLWAFAAGGRLGVGNDSRYNKSLCFDPFPFPDPPKHLRERIGLVAEALDQHRKDAIARDERVTMTGMYNVVEKLRSGEKLTDKERAVHEIAACGVLRDLHDDLDLLVAQAYGWPWPMEREEVLERLVALHDERVEEEKRGIIRWLRPEYQVPRFGGAAAAAPEPALDLPEAEPAPVIAAEPKQAWPAGAIEQIGAVKARAAASPVTPAEVAAAFAGAPVPLVARHLETLAMVGEVRQVGGQRYEAVSEPL